ncbi:MAG: DoxX family protein [Granulosicoccaceae bacterium]
MFEDIKLPHTQGNDAGKLVLRLAVGILLLLHGMAKIQSPEIVQTFAPKLDSLEFPTFFAWFSLVGELVAPILLIAGVFSRIAGVLIAIQMMLVMVIGNFSELLSFQETGGYMLELQALYLLAGVSVACLGSGIYALIRD